MATKYSISRSKEWKWRHEQGNPRITEHCQERWDERMPAAARSPEFAFRHATEAPAIEHHPLFNSKNSAPPGAIYVYRGRTVDGETYSAVFLENPTSAPEDALMTVYPIDSVHRAAVRSYLHAVRHEEDDTIIDEADYV